MIKGNYYAICEDHLLSLQLTEKQQTSSHIVVIKGR